MNVLKAPAGGTVSPVNGQWYHGGEFLPDHGHYCGRGRNRVSMATFSEVAERAQARGWTLRFNEKYGRFQFVLAGGNVMFSSVNLNTLAKFLWAC